MSTYDAVAARVGAASIYLVVGLLLGVAVALTALAVSNSEPSPPFAAVVFAVAGLSSALGAVFPRVALASLAPLSHLMSGLFSGSLAPDLLVGPTGDATFGERLGFWVGYVGSCALFVAWLLSY